MRRIKIGDKEFTLHYGQNAVCALEDELDKGITSIYTRLQQEHVKLRDFRAILWAGLLKDNRDLTPEDVGNMCDEANVRITKFLPDCTAELNESFRRLIPDEEADTSEDNEKNE